MIPVYWIEFVDGTESEIDFDNEADFWSWMTRNRSTILDWELIAWTVDL